MWLYLIAGSLIMLGVVLGFVGGGIFTIVLIPLGLIVLGAGLISAASSRRAQAEASGTGSSDDVTDRPLPHSLPRDTGRVRTTPEGLADARRAQQ
jgi:hypothetical protein